MSAKRKELRPEIVKRRFLVAFSVALSAVLISAVLIATSEKAGGKIFFYARIARLYTQEPDRKLLMPLSEVRKNQIANTWRAPRGDHLHEGQDIFAPRGTPIYSATRGYIYRIGEDRLGGHTVSIIGGGGRIYYYAHLDSYAPNISEQDGVSTQTLLGYVGTSGNAVGTPPHLHFGVYTPGGAINPLPLLVDRQAKKSLL